MQHQVVSLGRQISFGVLNFVGQPSFPPNLSLIDLVATLVYLLALLRLPPLARLLPTWPFSSFSYAFYFPRYLLHHWMMSY